MTMKPTPKATSADGTETLDRIDHVAISVDDIAKAVDWYRAHFRCRVAYQDATWAMLEFANSRLAFVLPAQHPPHVGFVTPDAESYGELKTHRDGTRSIYIPDSAGNAVELLAPYDTLAASAPAATSG